MEKGRMHPGVLDACVHKPEATRRLVPGKLGLEQDNRAVLVCQNPRD